MIERISRDRLATLLNAAEGKRVAVVGDAMLDVYLRGDVDRMSPEAPVPVVRIRERKLGLGGAGNVANNIVTIGAHCEIVCAVGNDVAGATVREMLRQSGTETRALVSVNRPTTTKTRVVARAQQLVRYDEEDDADLAGDETTRLLEAMRTAIDEADALVLQDYNKGVLVPDVIRNAIAWARQRGVPIVVDPKYRNFFSYRGATIFKPNRRELESALGASVDIDHPEALPATFDRLGVEHLLLTLGEKGMALLSADGEIGRIPTTAREVYDVVGAGDTVTAYLAAMLAAGGTPAEAAVVANFAAGVEVAKLGAATVTGAEVVEAFDDFALVPSRMQAEPAESAESATSPKDANDTKGAEHFGRTKRLRLAEDSRRAEGLGGAEKPGRVELT
ncbi:MAG: PfkB family carbohydrate kinase [Gemmatimonadota bacterium]|nr:PfkB family carbohydrate kinase [Gemmatimonadota bacterium]